MQEDKKVTFISEKREPELLENCIHKTPIIDIEGNEDSNDKKNICMLSTATY